jgi:hypothetical protein
MQTILLLVLVFTLVTLGSSYLTEKKPFHGAILIGLAMWMLLIMLFI